MSGVPKDAKSSRKMKKGIAPVQQGTGHLDHFVPRFVGTDPAKKLEIVKKQPATKKPEK
jgi:hypothetical protein